MINYLSSNFPLEVMPQEGSKAYLIIKLSSKDRQDLRNFELI